MKFHAKAQRGHVFLRGLATTAGGFAPLRETKTLSEINLIA